MRSKKPDYEQEAKFWRYMDCRIRRDVCSDEYLEKAEESWRNYRIMGLDKSFKDGGYFLKKWKSD